MNSKNVGCRLKKKLKNKCQMTLLKNVFTKDVVTHFEHDLSTGHDSDDWRRCLIKVLISLKSQTNGGGKTIFIAIITFICFH